MLRVLYINDDPIEKTYRKAFRDHGIDVDIIVAETEVRAREYLTEAETIDIVFMDYDMGSGRDNSTEKSGLVRAFKEAGFGVGKKPLVANSRSGACNDVLLGAGCSHVANPSSIDYFVWKYSEDLKKK